MTKKWSIKMLAEAGVMIAFATVLSLVVIYRAPYGGSVTPGSMIPIMVFALRWGTVPGILVGMVYGIIQFIADPQFYHPMQFLLDYPIAFGFLGLAGIMRGLNKDITSLGLTYGIIGVTTAMIGRFVSHLLSGVVFFAEYAGEMNPWIYSALYNGGYLGIEFVVSVIIITLLWKPLNTIKL